MLTLLLQLLLQLCLCLLLPLRLPLIHRAMLRAEPRGRNRHDPDHKHKRERGVRQRRQTPVRGDTEPKSYPQNQEPHHNYTLPSSCDGNDTPPPFMLTVANSMRSTTSNVS